MAAAYKVWITVFAFFALCADPLAAATSTKLPPLVLQRSSRGARRFFRRAVSCAAGVGATGGDRSSAWEILCISICLYRLI